MSLTEKKVKDVSKRYASYKGLMSDGASFGCLECEKAGRLGVMMTYRGIEQVSQIEGVDAKDTADTLPYDVWMCRFNHRHTDGY